MNSNSREVIEMGIIESIKGIFQKKPQAQAAAQAPAAKAPAAQPQPQPPKQAADVCQMCKQSPCACNK